MIGYLGEGPALIIVKNGFHNYLPGMPTTTNCRRALLQTETYFWESVISCNESVFVIYNY